MYSSLLVAVLCASIADAEAPVKCCRAKGQMPLLEFGKSPGHLPLLRQNAAWPDLQGTTDMWGTLTLQRADTCLCM